MVIQWKFEIHRDTVTISAYLTHPFANHLIHRVTISAIMWSTPVAIGFDAKSGESLIYNNRPWDSPEGPIDVTADGDYHKGWFSKLRIKTRRIS